MTTMLSVLSAGQDQGPCGQYGQGPINWRFNTWTFTFTSKIL